MFKKMLIIGLLGLPQVFLAMEKALQTQSHTDLALIEAVKMRDKNQIKHLLLRGANPLAIDLESKKTAFQIANELSDDQIIDLFYVYLHPDKQLPTELAKMVRRYVEDDIMRARNIKEAIENSKAYHNENPELIGHLIKKKFGQSALDQELLQETHTLFSDYVIALVKIGANVNATNSEFSTRPLLTAMRRNPALNLIKTLIDAGADLNVQDGEGFTPLMRAASYIDDHGIKLIKLLLAAGADRFFKSKIFDMSMTPREFAQHQLNYRNVKNNPYKTKILNEMIQILEDSQALQQAVEDQRVEFKPKF